MRVTRTCTYLYAGDEACGREPVKAYDVHVKTLVFRCADHPADGRWSLFEVSMDEVDVYEVMGS